MYTQKRKKQRKNTENRNERQRPFYDSRLSIITQSLREREKSKLEETVCSLKEKCSPPLFLPFHLLFVGIRCACEVEKRLMRLSQGKRRDFYLQIRSACFIFYSFCIKRYGSTPLMHALTFQIYRICIYLYLIRLNLNKIHACHLEILGLQDNIFPLNGIRDMPGLGMHIVAQQI